MWKISLSSLEEVTLRVGGVDAPEVVDEDVEDTENDDEECASPLGLEADCNHDTCTQAHDRDEDTHDGPLTLDDESEEEEDEENTAGEKEAGACQTSVTP